MTVGQAKDMGDGRNGKKGFLTILGIAEPGTDLKGVGEKIFMAEHDALGTAGCATGVLDDGRVAAMSASNGFGALPAEQFSPTVVAAALQAAQVICAADYWLL